MVCLTQHLNLMVGDLIGDWNDKHWQLYRKLREIFGIIPARRFSEGDVKMLIGLIEDHHKLYIRLYGNLKPK